MFVIETGRYDRHVVWHSDLPNEESDMSWHKVVIKNNASARWSAAQLMRPFIMGYHELGATPPDNVVVYHGLNDTGDHVYYFSPAASAIAINTKAFHNFDVTQLAEQPELDGYERVTIS
jgi:hypothetical protein